MSSNKRVYILEPVATDRGPEAPVAEARRRLDDMLGTMLVMGGDVHIYSDRVKIGEIPGGKVPCQKCDATGARDYGDGPEECRACGGAGEKDGPPEIIGETVGFVIEWHNVPRLRDDSLTARMMDTVLGPDPERDEPEHITGTGENGDVIVPLDDEPEPVAVGAGEDESEG